MAHGILDIVFSSFRYQNYDLMVGKGVNENNSALPAPGRAMFICCLGYYRRAMRATIGGRMIISAINGFFVTNASIGQMKIETNDCSMTHTDCNSSMTNVKQLIIEYTFSLLSCKLL